MSSSATELPQLNNRDSNGLGGHHVINEPMATESIAATAPPPEPFNGDENLFITTHKINGNGVAVRKQTTVGRTTSAAVTMNHDEDDTVVVDLAEDTAANSSASSKSTTANRNGRQFPATKNVETAWSNSEMADIPVTFPATTAHSTLISTEPDSMAVNVSDLSIVDLNHVSEEEDLSSSSLKHREVSQRPLSVLSEKSNMMAVMTAKESGAKDEEQSRESERQSEDGSEDEDEAEEEQNSVALRPEATRLLSRSLPQHRFPAEKDFEQFPPTSSPPRNSTQDEIEQKTLKTRDESEGRTNSVSRPSRDKEEERRRLEDEVDASEEEKSTQQRKEQQQQRPSSEHPLSTSSSSSVTSASTAKLVNNSKDVATTKGNNNNKSRKMILNTSDETMKRVVVLPTADGGVITANINNYHQPYPQLEENANNATTSSNKSRRPRFSQEVQVRNHHDKKLQFNQLHQRRAESSHRLDSLPQHPHPNNNNSSSSNSNSSVPNLLPARHKLGTGKSSSASPQSSTSASSSILQANSNYENSFTLRQIQPRSALSSDSYGSIRNLGSMARGIRMANRDTTNNNNNGSINNSSFKSQSTDVLNKLSTTTSSNSASPSPLNSSSVIEPLALTSWKTSTRENKQQQDTKKRSVGGQQQIQRMNKIETGLYLGNLEAATDVIFIQSHGISHIVTLDTVPLPRKIQSSLPKLRNLHLNVTDLVDEDILSYLDAAFTFIDDGLRQEHGSVLVHCFRGKSRSATVILAYLMRKHAWPLTKAMKKVRSKRPQINPHEGFLAQLKLFETMDFSLDPTNVQYKMFKLKLAAERMRKAKILVGEIMENLLDPDPGDRKSSSSRPLNMSTTTSSFDHSFNGGLSLGTSAGNLNSSFKSKNSNLAFKCKKCRRTLATSCNLIPHIKGESPSWSDAKWSLPADELLEGMADLGLELCLQSVFVNPIRWMETEIKANMAGKLYCPNCQTKVGQYSWIRGDECQPSNCKAAFTPSFSLDVTEIIFKTKSKFLQHTGREPVVV